MTDTKKCYKKSVNTQKYIEIGTVDDYGFIDFGTYITKLITHPSHYYPEFYIDVEDTKEIRQVSYKDGKLVGTKLIGNYITSVYKKAFTPKNPPQQIVTLKGSMELKPEEYYVTGYLTKDGVAVYYHQYLNE
jgi:hypothetical protein